MFRIKLFLTIMLWTIFSTVACRPILDAAGQHPAIQLLSHVAGPALTVAVQDRYAYLGFSYELVVLDIRDHTNPQWVAALPLPTTELVLAGPYAYVAGRTGFTVVDRHNPTQPRVLWRLPTTRTAVGVAVVGTDAYFIEDRRLHQVDVTDPRHPRLLRTLTLSAQLNHLTAAGADLYLSSWDGVQRWATTPHAAPQLRCTVAMKGYPSAVAVGDGYALFVNNERLITIDTTMPTACPVLAERDNPDTVFGLALAANRAYLANGSQGLRVWDLTDPAAPVARAAYPTHGIAMSVIVQDGLVYLVDCDDGLQILAADNPVPLTPLGAFTPLGAPERLVVAGDYAYVASGFASNLHQIAITDTAQLHTAATHLTASMIYGLALRNNALYVVLEDGLQVIDLMTPGQPVLGQHYPLADAAMPHPWHIAVQGAHAYLGDTQGNGWLLDLTAPVQPIGPPTYPALGNVGAMSLTDAYAYVPDQGVGVRIFAIDAAGGLTPVALYPTSATINQTAVAAGYLYLAAGRNGLLIVDVHKPTAPTLVQRYAVDGTAHDVTIVEPYALIAAGEAGLQVLDIRDPAQPVAVAAFATPDCAHAVVSSGGRIYLLDQWGGFYILTLTPP